jgi:phosphatidylinositol glycan class X
MQSYYSRYASLHDSDFENFMSQEVTSGLCEVLPENHDSTLRLSVLRRDLVGEGSHRRVSTLIKLQTQQLKSLSELLSYSCELIVIERLPSGVFADPFELQHLAQRGGKYSKPASGVSYFYIKELLHISSKQ